jgi:UPF0271 protein
MAKEKNVAAIDGTIIPVHAQTICVHADTPKAVDLLKSIRSRLEQEKVIVRSFGF